MRSSILDTYFKTCPIYVVIILNQWTPNHTVIYISQWAMAQLTLQRSKGWVSCQTNRMITKLWSVLELYEAFHHLSAQRLGFTAYGFTVWSQPFASHQPPYPLCSCFQQQHWTCKPCQITTWHSWIFYSGDGGDQNCVKRRVNIRLAFVRSPVQMCLQDL